MTRTLKHGPPACAVGGADLPHRDIARQILEDPRQEVVFVSVFPNACIQDLPGRFEDPRGSAGRHDLHQPDDIVAEAVFDWKGAFIEGNDGRGERFKNA